MAIYLNDGILSMAPKVLDDRFGPYTSVAEALIAIDPILRFRGLTAGVIEGGELKEYWFRNGTEDEDLIEKLLGGGGGQTRLPPDHEFFLPIGEDSGNAAVGSDVYTFRIPFHGNLIDVMTSVTTSPTGSDMILDVKRNGLSVLSELIQIDEGTESSKNSISPPVITEPDLPEDSEVSVDIIQVGSTSPGSGVKVYLAVNRAGE